MTIELTEEQRQALVQDGKTPVHVVDPATKATYVLVPCAVYEQMCSLLAQEKAEQKAWLDLAEEGAMRWMRENPY